MNLLKGFHRKVEEKCFQTNKTNVNWIYSLENQQGTTWTTAEEQAGSQGRELIVQKYPNSDEIRISQIY